MSIDLQASVVLIASSDPISTRFGTGFVVHQDEQTTYLLTCAHVVDDVGGAGAIDVGGLKAFVVASGSTDNLDLAVLRVEGLADKSPLGLRVSGERGSAFSTAGFQLFGKQYLIRPLQGTLGESVGLAIRGQAGYIKAWDLKIEDDYQLQPGYSGSPVVDQTSGEVLAVVSHRQGQGERGLAISIEALSTVWPDMPTDLLRGDVPSRTTTEPSDTPPVEAPKETKGDQDMSKPIEIFFSYAHEDEELRDKLAKHLSILRRQGKITTWHDRDITAGSDWAGDINEHLNSADIILLLISVDFMASDYCYDVEMTRALERHEAGEAVVIPVILRPTDWTSAPFGRLQALPKNAEPVTDWDDLDSAFLNITEGIHKVAQRLAAQSAAPRQSASVSMPDTSTGPTSGASIAAETQASAVEYNTSAVRNLLKAAFSDQDFMIFCYDNFRDVYDQFSAGMSFTQKTQRLIEHCEKNLVFDKLLQLVEAENPAQYQRFASQLRR